MIPYARRKSILEFMQSKEMVYLDEIQQQVNVSLATIRRDLKTLSEEGYIEQLSGGAARIITNVGEKSLSEKISLNKEEKEIIGSYAATLVQDGEFIFIGPGTTENHMIKHLESKDVTVATNGAFHIQELIKYNVNAILLGGNIVTDIGVLVGPVTLNQVSTMNFDKCFIGASGITFDRGISTSDIDVAEINKIAIKNSREVYFIGDSTKIGKNSRYTFAQIEEEHKLITTKNIDKKYIDDKRVIIID
ncbi:MAG: DeoR/GlpR transcriptional regulator [Firmicutes bacterium HGW-Firmicutes-7]|nr:MAG: DeoR/GlpR transcriptional regulator [Firmicutes bacterium HGW-Firmicutes-7]